MIWKVKKQSLRESYEMEGPEKNYDMYGQKLNLRQYYDIEGKKNYD